ncbi:MAG: hypothetical protein JW748_08975 [Anaerolineales bacterium]|nr:hypothetical protein [Anaerolineales bacterium]
MPRFDRPPRRIRPPLFPGRRRPFGAVRPLAPGPIRALADANRLFAGGQFGPAAEKFEMLAKAAGASRLPFAPRLFFQAARANWRLGQIPQGMQLLRTGLGILLTAGAIDRVRQIASSAADELDQLGLAPEAAEVRKFLADIPASAGAAAEASGMPPAEPAHPILPTNCGQCGALIRTEEIEWIDRLTAECAYCGSPIRPDDG